MSFARDVSSLGLGGAFALGLLFACANSEEGPGDPQPVPDAGGFDAVPDAVFDAPSDVQTEATAVVPGQCSGGGFCYVSMPVLSPIIAVSASTVDDAWMLPSDAQTILRWDGTSLKQVYEYAGATPPKITFGAIWAEKKDSVWAVASDSASRFFVVRYAPVDDGPSAFREFPTEEYAPNYPPGVRVNSVWGPPSSDVIWVAGIQSILHLRDDGGGTLGVERFNPTAGPGDRYGYQWHSVWGFADDDVYVGGLAYSWMGSRGVIAHYDGAQWSLKMLESGEAVYSLRGTPPGQPRQLWYTRWREIDKAYTRLAPIDEDGGGLGEDLFAATSPGCNGRLGDAVTPTAGWFSNGLVVCRWTGTKLEDIPTSLGGRPIVQQVNAIWAGSADEAWIVGASATGATGSGFAARRTRETAEGGTP